MPKTLVNPLRVNISIEKKLHEAAVARATALRLSGGFSELVSRVLNKHLAGKGRDILKMPRFFNERTKRAA